MALPEDDPSRLTLDEALSLSEGDKIVYQQVRKIEFYLIDGGEYEVVRVIPLFWPSNFPKDLVDSTAPEGPKGSIPIRRDKFSEPIERLVNSAVIQIRGNYRDGKPIEQDCPGIHYSYFTKADSQ